MVRVLLYLLVAPLLKRKPQPLLPFQRISFASSSFNQITLPRYGSSPNRIIPPHLRNLCPRLSLIVIRHVCYPNGILQVWYVPFDLSCRDLVRITFSHWQSTKRNHASYVLLDRCFVTKFATQVGFCFGLYCEMDRPGNEDEAQLAALCCRMDRLWSEQQIEVWDEAAPWLFANHLVILKPWVPNTPLHCYEFNSCVFWVQVFGLPLERCTESMISKAVRHIGRVLEVKVEHRDGSSLKAVRARVEIDIKQPLKTRILIKLEGKNIWLDFRYERLSHFCYYCGKLGHYAMRCPEFPFDDSTMKNLDSMYYGSWLQAEVKEHSPFWRTFYKPHHVLDDDAETISETP